MSLSRLRQVYIYINPWQPELQLLYVLPDWSYATYSFLPWKQKLCNRTVAQQKNVLKQLLDSYGIAIVLAQEVATFTMPMAPPTMIHYVA